MSLAPHHRDLVPTLIVPDEQTWTMLGHDPAGLGAEPSFEAASTLAVLVPERIPEQLRDPLAARLSELPGGEPVHSLELALPPSIESSEPSQQESQGHAAAAEDHGDGDMEDHDMMAIVGEPSADGLVMERIDLRFGPLAVPFPGGLVVETALDGDVVTTASIGGLRTRAIPPGTAPSIPDPLAPAAWAAVIARGADADAGRTEPCVATLELERCVSHLAWLRSLSRLLGWERLTTRVSAALAELTAIDLAPGAASTPDDDVHAGLDAGAASILRVLDLLQGSRSLRWRLADRGVITRARAAEAGLDGPSARASGVRLDCRVTDPIYAALGFELLVERDGDARARTLLRAREAEQSIELARNALAAGPPGRDSDGTPPATKVVEGPRGELRAELAGDGWKLAAPGSAGARAIAAEAMIGESWEDALVVLASFDLSPWECSD